MPNETGPVRANQVTTVKSTQRKKKIIQVPNRINNPKLMTKTTRFTSPRKCTTVSNRSWLSASNNLKNWSSHFSKWLRCVTSFRISWRQLSASLKKRSRKLRKKKQDSSRVAMNAIKLRDKKSKRSKKTFRKNCKRKLRKLRRFRLRWSKYRLIRKNSTLKKSKLNLVSTAKITTSLRYVSSLNRARKNPLTRRSTSRVSSNQWWTMRRSRLSWPTSCPSWSNRWWITKLGTEWRRSLVAWESWRWDRHRVR